MKFSVSLPPSASTVIGAPTDGVIVNVSLSSAAGSTPIVAKGATSAPAMTTFTPAASALLLSAVMMMEVNALIVDPAETRMLSPAWSVTDEPVDSRVTPEFTVRSSPAPAVSAAVSKMAPAAVMFALTTRGLPEATVMPAVPPVAVMGPLTVMPWPAAVLPVLETTTFPPPVLTMPVMAPVVALMLRPGASPVAVKSVG